MISKVVALVHGSMLLVMGLCVYLYMGVSPDFEVTTIKIKGNTFLSSQDVIKKTGIQPHTNILRINPAEVKSLLEKDPQIKRAAVRREFPNRVIVELQEREPFMVWRVSTEPEKKFYLVDREGVILKEFQGVDETPFDLPIFTSEVTGANKDVAYIQKVIPEIARVLQADIPLFKQIKEIFLFSPSNLLLIPYTKTPEIRIHLLDYQKNLEYLRRLLPQLDMTHLEYIDLRFKKRVVIKQINNS